MRIARHQLILLGFICQGLSWDGYLLVLANLGLWIACLKLPRRPINVVPALEIVLIIAGVFLGTAAGNMMGQSNHFAIGHGLTLLQAARMLRPLNRREQIFSVIAACMQIGVACTTILDYRFILIALAAVVVIPRSLAELGRSAFEDSVSTDAPAPLGWRTHAWIAGIMMVLFITFPRGLLGTPIAIRPNAANSPATLLDTTLDPTRGGTRPPNQVILQIEGGGVEALRSYALVDYIEGKWTPDQRTPWFKIPAAAPTMLTNYPLRRVRVKNVPALGRSLPTDGPALDVQGRFFRRPMPNVHDLVECEVMWNSPNNIYEYRLDTTQRPTPLSGPLLRRCLEHPAPTPAVRRWLDERIAGKTAPLQQARAIESYLRDNFTYRLGAPQLDRLNSLEDFLLNQREGHCERFASSLALLLRMQKIPSRVILGYIPGGVSPVSGWRNVRFRDAHSWTEAWFEETGWIALDATPRSGQPSSAWDVADLLESIDAVWYTQIVNYDAAAQRDLLQQAATLATTGLDWLRNNLSIVAALLALILAAWAWHQRHRFGWLQFAHAKGSATIPPAVLASEYYGRLLKTLARHGYHRQPHQTPHEFLRSLPQDAPGATGLLPRLTDRCCTLRYSDRPAESALIAAMESELDELDKVKVVSTLERLPHKSESVSPVLTR